jgi:hypothetical protein
MANSTFSGPVRSQNGFQELVDGVWTPLGGGGGGGVNFIPYTPGITTYNITGLTEFGDSASFVWEYHLPQNGDALVLTATGIPNVDNAVFVVLAVRPNVPNSAAPNTGDVTISYANTLSINFTVTYSGISIENQTFAVLNVNAFYLEAP